MLTGGSLAASTPSGALPLPQLAVTTEPPGITFYTAVLKNKTFSISRSVQAAPQQPLATKTQQLREVAQLSGVPSASLYEARPGGS